MGSERPFYPRLEVKEMGQVLVGFTVENALDATKRIESIGMVDTGAFGLILPSAWRAELGPLHVARLVDLETADQRIVTAEVRGPVTIALDGFDRISSEVVFVDLEPGPHGRYEPLIGYTVLELANVVVDMRRHCLVARRYYDLKRFRAA